MSDQTPYTPCLPEARDDYATGVSPVLSLEDAYAAFDRLIAQVRAEALREAATIADESEAPEPSTEDYESRKLRALGGGESEALCPDCRGELTSWFCDRCSNTGLIKREPQGEPSDAQVKAALDAISPVGSVPISTAQVRAALRAAGEATS